MSAPPPPPPETGVAYIFDAGTFLKGLRSISLRNLSLSLRGGAPPGAAAVGGVGLGKGRGNGERDSGSVTSASLPNLRAEITTHDAGDAGALRVGNGSPNQNHGTAARGRRRRRSSDMWRSSSGTNSVGGGGGTALLTTGVSQPTVNPTWPVSETSWLHADAKARALDSTRLLVLRVFSVDALSEPSRDPSRQRPAQTSGQAGPAIGRAGDRKNGEAGIDSTAVWECPIDVRGLTALPEGSRLSHLWTLPADCLLVEMSNGGLYAPGWVVQALSSNSALPEAVTGGGGRGRGEDSDDEDDEEEEPLDQVLRKALKLEEEAEKRRAELAAVLEKAAPGDRQACAAAETACAVETLQLRLSRQKELLEMEEASFARDKRNLEAETIAIEELLTAVAEAEEAAAEDARDLESEKRETLKSHVLLEARRARLTAELQAIYPIKYHGKINEFTIRGLELPGDLYSIDDERISSALGYTAHLVCMLAKYLQIPLRYQVIYNASRSAMRDNVTGAGVAYPLFRKGVEKERFDRGVYLLGRDVEQMLAAREVPAKRGAGQLLRNLERLMSIEGV